LGATIIGASFDPVAELLAFATDQEFPFALVSDTDRSVGVAYGVARPAGDKFAAFARRISFLIDPGGVIRRVYDVADVATHADEVLDDLRLLAR
jgi:thioredoxin-dependent peroxiredoxin